MFWNSDLFDLVEYGAEDIGQLAENQRLFWVRLAVESGATLVVATAHFTWTGNIREITEQINVRVGEAEAAAERLDDLVRPDEPLLLMGDFNDYIHPIRMLRMAGFDDSFMALGLEPVITFPAFPIPHQPPELVDCMMHRGPIRPTLTSVVDFYAQGFPPSDHKPVLTTYRLDERGLADVHVARSYPPAWRRRWALRAGSTSRSFSRPAASFDRMTSARFATGTW